MKKTMKPWLAAWLLLTAAGAVAAYPEKPVKVIVPYAAGGGADTASRLISQKLSGYWGQQFVVENRPGGNAVIGTSAIAKASPDGYTIGMVISAHAVNPFVTKDMPYDAVKDFEPISYVARMPGVLLVPPAFPAKTLGELVAMAKRQPREFFYAVPGGLTNGHVSMEMLKLAAGIDVTAVMYKGGAPATVELMAGRVQMMIAAPPAAMPFVQSGKLKALATTGAVRAKSLDQLPTFIESGFAGFETYEWFGMLAPAHTPAAIIEQLSGGISTALKDEKIIDTLSKSGLEVLGGGPQDLKRFLERELTKMRTLTQAVKLDSE